MIKSRVKSRVSRLGKLIPAEVGGYLVDSVLVTSLPNRYYLSGMKSSDGFVLVTPHKAYLLVDFRYYEAACQIHSDCEVILMESWRKTFPELIKRHHIKGVLLESGGIMLAQALQIRDFLNSIGVVTLAGNTTDTLLWKLRMVKSPDEIEKIKAAQQITEAAFDHVLGLIREGVTERELALEIEFYMRRQGAQGVAFDLIVVAGQKGSLCHGEPDDHPVRKGDFITMDIGAVLDGYHSDMTRTVALGQVSREQEDVYNLVLKAQLAAIERVRPGEMCGEVDKAARDIIYGAGYEGCFGHSTGHGVGMEIHEEPRFSAGVQTVLEPGMVITVEPGIYLPGRFGVRIEDMVAVTETGCENLTHSPKDLIRL